MPSISKYNELLSKQASNIPKQKVSVLAQKGWVIMTFLKDSNWNIIVKLLFAVGMITQPVLTVSAAPATKNSSQPLKQKTSSMVTEETKQLTEKMQAKYGDEYSYFTYFRFCHAKMGIWTSSGLGSGIATEKGRRDSVILITVIANNDAVQRAAVRWAEKQGYSGMGKYDKASFRIDIIRGFFVEQTLKKIYALQASQSWSRSLWAVKIYFEEGSNSYYSALIENGQISDVIEHN